MPALAELEAAWVAARDDAGFRAELERAAARLRRPPDAAVPRPAAVRGGRPPRLPQARGPQPHRRAQDQQRARPGAARQAHGQDAHHRRDRRGPARRRHRHRVRAARARVRRLHGHRGHAPPAAQRRSAWGCWARRVEPVDAGARTLKEAVSAAIRDWVANVADTHYVIGSVRRPGAVPGARARPAARDRRRGARPDRSSSSAGCPTRVIACVGGGSNAIGIFVAVRRRRRRRADRRRGRGRGDRDRPPRRAAHHRRPRRRAARRLLGDHAGRGRPDPRGALDLGRARLPRHRPRARAGCATRGRARYVAVTDDEALDAFQRLAELEGIIPALESSHALAWVLGPGRRGAAPDTSTCLPLRAAATRTSPRRCAQAAASTADDADRPASSGSPRRSPARAGPRGADAVPDGRLPGPRGLRARSARPTPTAAPTSSSSACRSPTRSPTAR